MIIKLNSVGYPISEEVGVYIDELVEQKNSCRKRFIGIKEMAESWLESDCNTIEKAKEKVAFSLILGLAIGE